MMDSWSLAWELDYMFLARESMFIAVCMFIASHIAACGSGAHLGWQVRLVIAVVSSVFLISGRCVETTWCCKILYQPSLLSIISRRLVRFLGLLFLFSLWQIWWVLIRDSERRKQHLSPAYPSMWRMASVARLQGVLRGFGVFYLRVEGVEIFALFLWGRLMESDKSSFAWVQVYIKAWDKQNSEENELTVKGFIQFLFDLMGNLPRSWKMKS